MRTLRLTQYALLATIAVLVLIVTAIGLAAVIEAHKSSASWFTTGIDYVRCGILHLGGGWVPAPYCEAKAAAKFGNMFWVLVIVGAIVLVALVILLFIRFEWKVAGGSHTSLTSNQDRAASRPPPLPVTIIPHLPEVEATKMPERRLTLAEPLERRSDESR